ncbi:MAG: POTRA domain-containing protein [Stenotrophobium sp.]
MKQALCLCLMLILTVPAYAADQFFPVVREIRFEGNAITQPKTMLREMVIHVGDPADPQKVERSRQAILDLGLFKEVSVRQEPLPDGVRLVYTVTEKYYFLPYPRLSANLDRQYGYGAELEWNNVAGLNHSLNLLVTESQPNRTGYGKQFSYAGNYYAPFILDTPYNLSLSAGHSRQPQTNTATQQPFVETFDTWEIDGSRTYPNANGPASQGWTVGGGWKSLHENRFGPGAPTPYGAANAAVGFITYHDIRDLVYSEEGQQFGLRAETAVRGLASDYGYTLVNLSYDRFLPVGRLEFENLQLSAATGAYFNGPAGFSQFNLGGNGGLRAFPSYIYTGNSYYYLAALYQRPLGRPWLRTLVGIESGNVSTNANSAVFDSMHLSLDLGLRVRLVWFVNLQLEAGWAIPLNGSSRGRVFGGRP